MTAKVARVRVCFIGLLLGQAGDGSVSWIPELFSAEMRGFAHTLALKTWAGTLFSPNPVLLLCVLSPFIVMGDQAPSWSSGVR